jgi:hypothetical protein
MDWATREEMDICDSVNEEGMSPISSLLCGEEDAKKDKIKGRSTMDEEDQIEH